MKKLIRLTTVVLFAIGITACSISPRQELVAYIQQIQKTLPLQFGHGLQMSDIQLENKELKITVDCDTLNCLLSDSVLCTESFTMRLLNGGQDFYQALSEEEISVHITYLRGESKLYAALTTPQITDVCQQNGTYRPMPLLELTTHEFKQLKAQLPRMEDETLCLYDAFVKGKEITFVYIYPEEITKESLALTDNDIKEMKSEHSEGLLQSYSMADLDAFKAEGAVFVYMYVTPNELLCTVKVPAKELVEQSIPF